MHTSLFVYTPHIKTKTLKTPIWPGLFPHSDFQEHGHTFSTKIKLYLKKLGSEK